MADDIAVLGIKVDSRQVKKADGDLDKLAKTSARTAKATDGLTGSTNKASTGLTSYGTKASSSAKATGALAASTTTATAATNAMTRALQGATVAILGFIGARAAGQLVRYADEFTGLENRLRQVTNTTEELTDVTAKLFSVSNRTRSGVSDTVTLYQRLALSSSELGLSQAELIRLTETINKSMSISGATAAEASGAIRQLAQGLASGALRGDEFNSVAEQAPDIMRAIAKETGLTIGALREFAATGGITADIVVKALQGVESEIDDKYSQSIATFEQKTTLASNALVEFAGKSEGLKTAVGLAGDAVLFGAEALTFFLDNLGLVSALIVARSVPSMVALAVSMRGYATATGLATVATRGFGAAMALLGGPVGLVLTAAVGLYAYITATDDTATSTEKLTKRTEELNKELAELGTLKQLTDRSESVREELMKTQKVIDELQKKNDAINIYGGKGPFDEQLASLRGSAAELTEELNLVDNRLQDVFVNGLSERLKGAKEYGRGSDELTDAVKDITAALEEELKLLGMSAREISLYKAQAKAGVGANTILGDSIKKVNDKLFDEKERLAEVAAQRKKNTENMLIAVDAEIAAIEAAEKASKKASEEMERDWLATRDIVADVFVDIAENGLKAFDNIAKSFKNMLVRMVAQAAANRVLIAVGIGGVSGSAAAGATAGISSMLPAGVGALAGSSAGTAIGSMGGAVPLAGAAFGAISGFQQSGIKGGIAGAAGGFGGAKLGAALGSLAGPIGAIVGSALGGLIGGKLGGSLFGGEFKTKETGIELSVGSAGLIAQAFENQRKKGGAFSSSSSRTLTSDLDPATMSALSGAFGATTQAVVDGFELLGTKVSQNQIDAFSKTSFQVNLGADEVANAQAIADFFSTVGTQLVNAIGGSSVTFERMVELTNAIKSANPILAQLNTAIFETSIAGAEAAERLIESAGGIEALNHAAGNFFDMFVESRSSFEILSDGLESVFETIDGSLPATRQGFASLVQGLDKTTESGMNAFVSLINMSSQANDYYSELERLEADRASSLAQSLTSATDQALESLRASVNAEKALLDVSIQDTKSNISSLTSLSRALSRAVTGSSNLSTRQVAQQTLSMAASSGSLIGRDFSSELEEIAKPSEQLFGSFTDYMRDFQTTNNILDTLREETESQLSVEEKSLASLIDQKSALDEILNSAIEQVNVLRGIHSSLTMSVQGASAGLSSAISNEQQGGATAEPSGNPAKDVDDLYRSILGRESDIGGLLFYANAIGAGTMTLGSVRRALESSPEATGIPAFANGGNHSGGVRMVGERGPELEFTGPSRIMSNADIMSSMGGGDLKAELQQLRADLKSGMFAIARNTMQSYKLLDRWDGDGQPPVRVV